MKLSNRTKIIVLNFVALSKKILKKLAIKTKKIQVM